ncbi:hypothetical protein [Verrucosispora sp. WMMC514]|uniref:hypothetical protein n=1 Tax=Verrucosispora sp. WMMC514 TaxID=3015156 RepID=UPI00248D2515|nr:hypothetical protein [Verrucosispora sp. WMMC514]WBB91549.1 hypothetical protein O7597_00390 [Verrucosispora sp. WMMC514]
MNGREFSADTAATYLSEQRSGVHDVTLVNGEARQEWRAMDDEIQLISDGDGLGVIGTRLLPSASAQ